jgi:hypothetical protein
MMQGVGQILTVKVCAVVALDQERDAARSLQVMRKSHRFIERGEFLEEMLSLAEGADRLGPGGAGIDPEHARSPFLPAKGDNDSEATKVARSPSDGMVLLQ